MRVEGLDEEFARLAAPGLESVAQKQTKSADEIARELAREPLRIWNLRNLLERGWSLLSRERQIALFEQIEHRDPH